MSANVYIHVQKHLHIESSIWGSLCLLSLLARLASKFIKRKTNGRFQLDDCLMILSFCAYIAVVVGANIFAINDFLFIDPSQQLESPKNMRLTILGGKLCLITEVTMLTCIWSVKMCLLMLYSRLTQDVSRNIALKVVIIYVAISYVVLLVLLMAVFCRPLDQYWSLAPTNSECQTFRKYFIVHISLNVSSDLLIIAIPWSFLATLNINSSKKGFLLGIFSLGIFVIIAACLTKYYSLTEPYNPHWEFWYIREASTAILVANIPLCLPLLQYITSITNMLGYSSWSNVRSSISRQRTKDTDTAESVDNSIYHPK